MNYFAIWIMLFGAPAVTPRPNLALGPAEVVRIVVDALRENNSPLPNAGVFTAYQFASPGNHAVTGPYGRFLQVVKTSDFIPLFKKYPREFEAIAVNGDYAEQILRVKLDGGMTAAYKFMASQQKEGACRGCWMLDGVVKVP